MGFFFNCSVLTEMQRLDVRASSFFFLFENGNRVSPA